MAVNLGTEFATHQPARMCVGMCMDLFGSIDLHRYAEKEFYCRCILKMDPRDDQWVAIAVRGFGTFEMNFSERHQQDRDTRRLFTNSSFWTAGDAARWRCSGQAMSVRRRRTGAKWGRPDRPRPNTESESKANVSQRPPRLDWRFSQPRDKDLTGTTRPKVAVFGEMRRKAWATSSFPSSLAAS